MASSALAPVSVLPVSTCSVAVASVAFSSLLVTSPVLPSEVASVPSLADACVTGFSSELFLEVRVSVAVTSDTASPDFSSVFCTAS